MNLGMAEAFSHVLSGKPAHLTQTLLFFLSTLTIDSTMYTSSCSASLYVAVSFYYDIKHTKELGKTQFYPVGLTVPSRFRYLILPGVNNYIRRE